MAPDVIIKDRDFMCRCNPEGEAECDLVLNKAWEIVDRYNGSDNSWGWLINAILYDLAIDGELHPMADQWGGWSYKLQDIDASIAKKEFVSRASCLIQCDDFVDGLAAVFLWKKQKEDQMPSTP